MTPIRGARSSHQDFVFFFAFFFFVAMIVFLGFGDEPTAGLVQLQADLGIDLGPWALAPLPNRKMPQGGSGCNRKMQITLIFP
ncbi:MAG: hypothetical protein WCA56_06450 [Xanthobacteraceae bacterium]